MVKYLRIGDETLAVQTVAWACAVLHGRHRRATAGGSGLANLTDASFDPQKNRVWNREAIL